MKQGKTTNEQKGAPERRKERMRLSKRNSRIILNRPADRPKASTRKAESNGLSDRMEQHGGANDPTR